MRGILVREVPCGEFCRLSLVAFLLASCWLFPHLLNAAAGTVAAVGACTAVDREAAAAAFPVEVSEAAAVVAFAAAAIEADTAALAVFADITAIGAISATRFTMAAF